MARETYKQAYATAKQDLNEIWFPGSHCDVGGGYPRVFSTNPEVISELWRLSFDWIVDEAQKAGLLVDQDRLATAMPSEPADREIWADLVHESLTEKWKLAEYWRKKTWNSQTKTYEWKAGNSTPRVIPENALIHDSALKRLRKSSLKYEPANISAAFRQQVDQLTSIPLTLPYASGNAPSV